MTTPPRDDPAHDRMAAPPDYAVFGFPLANLSGPDQAITKGDLWDTVWPLLEGTQYLLRALGVALVTEDITGEQANTAIALLEGHVATALHILNRWSEKPGTPAGVEGEAHGTS